MLVCEGANLVESNDLESLNDESSESEEDNEVDSENNLDVEAIEGNEIDEKLIAARENVRAYKRSKKVKEKVNEEDEDFALGECGSNFGFTKVLSSGINIVQK
ncbi:hypothetical protein GH714_013311 [Hevea brasiliensis]|uniref:Uncharacterized protein n=1 Tax=Hevea brasiliensis TaxID=3981 RepID=A0A6A6L8Z3_HEVBR|nr:hypothetical protein GH714_013311 [Hevea brasiliensis]